MSNSYSPLLKVNDPTKFNNSSPSASVPLIPLIMSNTAPMAKSEIDEIDADHSGIPLAPMANFTGIDDGFFDQKSRSSDGDDKTALSKQSEDSKVPEFELTVPSTPNTTEIPSISLRFGEDDNTAEKTDQPDGVKTEEGVSLKANRSFLSPTSHLGMDFEAASVIGGTESIPDVNIYQHKKTLAQGMMDLALFSANANQLRYVLESSMHPYFYPSVVLISFSLIMQVAVGIGLIWNATYNVRDEKEICIANKINNFTVIGIFLVTVINVFISAFGVANTNN